MSMFRNLLTLAVLFGLSVATLAPSFAQEVEKKTEDAAETAAEVDKSLPLSARQRAIFARYKRFKHTLEQMHQYMRKTDPDRADLLARAITSAGENRISTQLERIVEMMDQRDVLFGDVIDRQEELTKHLNALLDLLQSEDRLSDIEKEKKRIEELLKDVRELIGKEKVVRAQTERGGDEDRIAGKQQKVADDTNDLGKKIDKQDASKNGDQDKKPGDKDGKPSDPKDGKPSDPKDGKPSDSKPKDGKPSDGKPSDGKPSDGKPGDKKDDKDKKDGDKKDGDKKDGDKKDKKPGDKKDSKPQDGKPSDGKPQDGEPSDGKPKAGKPKDSQPKPQPKPPEGGETIPGKKKKPGQDDDKQDSSQKKNRTPGREELEKAHAEMERAIEELKKKNRKGASAAEDEALAELIKAKEKLEEILRQLREEERELILAALEARFRKMLAMQYDVLNGTDQITRVSKSEWQENHRNQMQRLTAKEQEIAREAEKALTILKAEGTSVAFPLAVEGIRDDVLTISDLLARLQDGDQDPMDPFAPEGQEVRMQRDKMFELTVGLEKDVIAALKELIDALQKEMEKDKKEKDGKPSDSNGDPVLVDKLAELKMLRTLQMRVNRQTKRMGLQVDGEQATQPFIVVKLKQLAKLQAKIQKTAYDLATTRNQ